MIFVIRIIIIVKNILIIVLEGTKARIYLCSYYLGGGLNQHLQNYKWNPLWLYMRLWDVKRFFEIFSVLTLHRPPQISEKWGKMAHFGRFPTFSYWLVWSLNY